MPAPVALRADAARNRALVLDAAERLLATRGLDVSMQEIAVEAGVGVGTIFRRFATKDDLIATIVELRMAEVVALAEQALERVDDQPWAAFETYFTGVIELQVRHRALVDVAASACGAHPAIMRAHGESIALLEQVVERAQRAGAVRRDLQARDLPALQCAVSRIASVPVSCGGDPDAWRRASAIVLDGLRAR